MSTVSDLILRAQCSRPAQSPAPEPAIPSFSPRHGTLDEVQRRHDQASGRPRALCSALPPAPLRRGVLGEVLRRHEQAAKMARRP